MRKRPWLKWIGILLCLGMIVCMAFIMKRVQRANEAERAKLRVIAAEYEQVMRPLWKERARLEQQIIRQEEIVAEEAPNSPVVLLCTEPDERIISDVFPITHQYFYPAVIVIWEDAFPSEPGCLSVIDTLDLCERGWEICLGIEAGTDLTALCQRTADEGLPLPVALYASDGELTPEQEEEASELGIQTVICYGKKTQQQTEGFWYLSAYGSNETDSKTAFQEKVRNAMPQALTVGYRFEREQFSESNFGNMLKTVNNYERSNDVTVMSIEEAGRPYLQEPNDAFAEPMSEAEQELKKYRDELDAINEKIRELENGYRLTDRAKEG